ncbi:MAG TPA: HisS family protein [Thermomicrobiales bacterium]|nr:HisS family protein [Thermomicrobiales bacterium]
MTLPGDNGSRPFTARPVDRVRGTYDRLAGEQRSIDGLRARLAEAVRRHDYSFIETPVVEHTELFMRKSGGDRLAQIYAFNHRGRDLALRPEHTASIVRAYIENLQSEPLPVRLAYSGPVFRYEKPQAGRSRQFTEFGCELIGAGGLLADAEILRLALHTLRAAGIATPHIVLGHIGVVSGFLSGLHIDQRAQDWLIWTMERLRDNQSSQVDIPEYLVTPPAGTDSIESLDHLDQDAVIALLRQSGVQFEGASRTPEEIVSGLFEQRQRRYDYALMRDALGFVRDITRLSGPPGEVLEPLRELVGSRNIDPAPLDEVEQMIDLLEAVDGEKVNVTIDLGMGRGLRYYTGMLFEIYSVDGGPQLCGGGRYDDLAQTLGARQPVEACGFSLGLERIQAASSSELQAEPMPRVLIWPGDRIAESIRIARDFRQKGWIASVDPRQRSVGASRRAAHRQGYDAFVQTVAEGFEMVRLGDGETTSLTAAPEPKAVMA